MGSNKRVNKIHYGITTNFDFSTKQQADEPEYISDLQKVNLTPNPPFFDIRTFILEQHIDSMPTLDNPTWYYNYLRINLDLSCAHPNSQIQYMLRLGYVPVCFLPEYVKSINHIWFTQRLNELGIPFAQLRARSFVYSKMQSNQFDVWVSKMDVYKRYNKEPHQVLSRDIIEELL